MIKTTYYCNLCNRETAPADMAPIRFHAEGQRVTKNIAVDSKDHICFKCMEAVIEIGVHNYRLPL